MGLADTLYMKQSEGLVPVQSKQQLPLILLQEMRGLLPAEIVPGTSWLRDTSSEVQSTRQKWALFPHPEGAVGRPIEAENLLQSKKKTTGLETPQY